MKSILFLFTVCACVAYTARSEKAIVFSGGGLNLQRRNISFEPYLVNPGWKGMGKTFGMISSGNSQATGFSVEMPISGVRFKGTVGVRAEEEGSLEEEIMAPQWRTSGGRPLLLLEGPCEPFFPSS